jgi:hypothetical protein
MSLEPIGLATLVVGLICLMLGYRAAAATLVAAGLFGSAAALIIGSANIQPGHVFLGFVAVAALSRRREAVATLRALGPSQPGFWLACLVVYGLVSAYFLPRVLAGLTDIIPLGSSAYDDTGSTVPLGPVSSNLTQSIYLLANVLCFAMTVAIASTEAGFRAVLGGLIAFCVGNGLFAFLDLGTYATGTQDLMGFMRNAQYTLHTDVEVSGMKRIVGSFTEASSFARSTLGVLGLTGTLWLAGYKPLWTGPLALVSLVLLVLSTSSTGLVGAPVILLMLYGTALARCGPSGNGRHAALAVLIAPPLVIVAALIVLTDRTLSQTLYDYVNLAILDKSSSDSGMERSSWNAVAFRNFLDTWGIGVGLGTVRASSFVLALLSNVGLPGALFYAVFALTAFVRRRGTSRSFHSDVRLAARNACFGLILGDLLVSPVIDQGLFFYVLAGIASAEPERATDPAGRMREARA